MTKKTEHYCGECCWFFAECTDGNGMCAKHYWDVHSACKTCGTDACENFISREDKRHYMAVLTQHNRWRRSDEVPNHCRMVNPTELGKAIDFVLNYIKTYDKI